MCVKLMCDVSRAQWSKDVLRLRVPFYVIVTAIIIKFAAILFKFVAIITLYLQQLNLYICFKFSFNSHQFNIFLSVSTITISSDYFGRVPNLCRG